MGKVITLILIVSISLGLAGCQFGPVKDKGGDSAQGDAKGGNNGGDTSTGLSNEGSLDIRALDDPNSPLSNRVVYFDLDNSQLNPSDRELLGVHAQFMSQHPEISVVLEGHADERGTREYNLALGEGRAKAVQQLLLLQGVTQKQIQIISFGEERPVARDHNESAWRLNRRVELLYSGY